MSILLKDKDYAADGAGSVVSVTGADGVLNDVLFRLSARRGGFPLLPELGSRMYLLQREKPSRRGVLARQYAAEALADLTDVTVTDAVVTPMENGISVHVELAWRGDPLSVELEV